MSTYLYSSAISDLGLVYFCIVAWIICLAIRQISIGVISIASSKEISSFESIPTLSALPREFSDADAFSPDDLPLAMAEEELDMALLDNYDEQLQFSFVDDEDAFSDPSFDNWIDTFETYDEDYYSFA